MNAIPLGKSVGDFSRRAAQNGEKCTPILAQWTAQKSADGFDARARIRACMRALSTLQNVMPRSATNVRYPLEPLLFEERGAALFAFVTTPGGSRREVRWFAASSRDTQAATASMKART